MSKKAFMALVSLLSVAGSLLPLSALAIGDVTLSPGMTILLQPYEQTVVRCGIQVIDTRGGGRGGGGRGGGEIPGYPGPISSVPACSVKRVQDNYGYVSFQVLAGDGLLDTRRSLDEALQVLAKVQADRLCLVSSLSAQACSVKRVQDNYGYVSFQVLAGPSVLEIKRSLDEATLVVKQLRDAQLCI